MDDKYRKIDYSKLDHIQDDVLQKDIDDTELEIRDLTDEEEVLNRNPGENKVRLYFILGAVLKRAAFVNKLRDIKEFRGSRELKDV